MAMEPSSPRRTGRQLIEAFWVLDAMLLALAIFFAIVGGAVFESTAFVLAMVVCAVLLALHGYSRHRHHDDVNLSLDARRSRERRGF
jgi:hypothetical protein